MLKEALDNNSLFIVFKDGVVVDENELLISDEEEKEEICTKSGAKGPDWSLDFLKNYAIANT